MNKAPKRLMSLDAYRGFVMLAMASSGLAFAKVAPLVRNEHSGESWGSAWTFLWDTLAYQFDHVQWTGCSFWDLIQPSFMFMVGVALPFSMQRRVDEGENPARQFLHAIYRACVLIAMGVLLSSSTAKGINFTFVNVLSQIGLGYVFLFLLSGRSLKALALSAAVILIGYGAWFTYQPINPVEATQTQLQIVKSYAEKAKPVPPYEWSQFRGHAAHWNKHMNAAAQVDRTLLNKFPRPQTFWFNEGGYQTLNFIPSIATMIFGLMAGVVLRSDRSDRDRLKWLIKAGFVCFFLSMAADTTIWPTQWLPLDLQEQFYEHSWSLCPAVKRIWSPTWAVFSAGWAFWMLAGFYWFVDIKGWQKPVFPLAVVGINSIAMYCMSQLFRGWIGDAFKTLCRTVDQIAGWSFGLSGWTDADRWVYAPVLDNFIRLCILWGICVVLYRKRLFLRI